MSYQKIEIKQGINLHIIKTKNFKTNLFAAFLTTPLDRNTVTKNTLISSVLRRGTKSMPTQEDISKNLEYMYGATFNCGVEKIGDNHILKFYLESLNDEFLPTNENVLEKSITNLLEIVSDPILENGCFVTEYINTEKENLKQIINGKIDDKPSYAFYRCTEEMYKDEAYGLYKYGYIEDLDDLNAGNLYEYYQNLLSSCKIDFIFSGDIDENQINQIINASPYMNSLQPRMLDKSMENDAQNMSNTPNEITENLDVTQGQLIIGLNINTPRQQAQYTAILYNAILRRNTKLKNVSKCQRERKSGLPCIL